MRRVLLALMHIVALSFSLNASSFAPRPVNKSFSRSINLKMSSESPPALDPNETALVLIEYQNEFTTQGGKLYDAVKECMEATGTLENSKKVMDAARDAGCTIIHCPISFEKGHKEISSEPYGILAGVKEGEAFTAGTWGAEICEIMKPKETDLIVKGKSGLCGFASTNLAFLLRQNEIKNVVLAGFLTNCCVESTMRSAYEEGFKVFTLKDCCAATSLAGQEAAYEHTFGMFSVPTESAEFLTMLSKAPAAAGTYH